MINTDGVTAGFDVDDVKLEEGAVATPFLDTGGEPTFELLGELPELIASKTDEVTLQFYLHAPEAGKSLRVSVAVTGRDGEQLAAVDHDLDVPAGLHGLELAWDVRGRAPSSRKHPNPSEPGELERAGVQPQLGPAAPKETAR